MPKEWKKPKPTESERRKAASDAKKTIARNKKARHDYLIEDTWEAGMVLSGTEVKALRMGRASLVDAWVEIKNGEAWLYGANIPMYAQGSWTTMLPRGSGSFYCIAARFPLLPISLLPRDTPSFPLSCTSLAAAQR